MYCTVLYVLYRTVCSDTVLCALHIIYYVLFNILDNIWLVIVSNQNIPMEVGDSACTVLYVLYVMYCAFYASEFSPTLLILFLFSSGIGWGLWGVCLILLYCTVRAVFTDMLYCFVRTVYYLYCTCCTCFSIFEIIFDYK